MPREPPAVAAWLLERALPEDERQPVLGDLYEVYQREAASRGRGGAEWWYWRHAVVLAVRFGVERVREGRTGDPAVHRGAAGSNAAWHAARSRRNRRVGMLRTVEGWARDLAHGGRSLVRAPGFTLVAVMTLALGIGANTAIFSVIDAVLVDPLSFPEPDRLVAIAGTAPGTDLPEEFGVGTEFYVQYKENATKLADLGLYQTGQTTVRAGDQVERLFVSAVSPSLFSTLGATTVLGRLPTNEDEEAQVVVLSHWLWTDWFGRDPSVIGKSYEISGALRTVIGVMEPGFRFPQEQTALWLHDLPTEPIRPGGFGLGLVGRLAPGADIPALTSELATLASRLPERFGGGPSYARIIENHRPVVRTLKEQMVGDVAGPLWLLLGTVGVVLLIACANVANLLIARSESRQRDLAVRRALGAGRGGLIRMQMAEALILALVGGVAGVFLARIGVPLLVRAAPENIPGLSGVGIDPAALLFTGAVVLIAACASGLLPAIRSSRPDVLGGLRTTGRTGAGPEHFTRDALVVVQTAAALVLLVASGLLFQSFRALSRVDPGFDTEDILTFQMAPDPREHGLVDGPAFAQFHYDFMDRVAALAGVESVGMVNTLPLDEGAGATRFVTERMTGQESEQPLLRYTIADGDYFRTMGIDLLSGEMFQRSARPTGGEVRVMVSRSAAELLWPGENPLGKLLHAAADTTGWMTVTGVVEDVMLSDLRQDRPDPMVYLPVVGRAARSWAIGTPAYVVKTSRAETIAPEIREVIREVAPSAPMYRVSTMAALAGRSMAQLSFTMMTVAIAAGLALVLGAVGLYGVLSYVVSQRTREIGIRMALGAQTRELRRMVVAQGSRVALVGVAIGVVAAFFLTRVLNSLLFGIQAVDAPTFIAMSGLMVGVAIVASYVPAHRASSVDPIHSLRAE